jgi:hypothetical protein
MAYVTSEVVADASHIHYVCQEDLAKLGHTSAYVLKSFLVASVKPFYWWVCCARSLVGELTGWF